MRLLVARGESAPRLGGIPAGAVVTDLRDVAQAGASWDVVLVVGTTADVARVVVALPVGCAIAFAGAPEVCRLFAVEPGLGAALQRATRGEQYPMDLGWLTLGGVSRPFLGAVTCGAGATRRRGFPWAGRDGEVTVRVDAGRPRSGRARAVTVSNLQHWGDWTLSPRSAPNDGKLEIQSFGGGLGSLIRVRRLLRPGTQGGDDGVRRSSGAGADVQVPARWRVAADGNIAGRGSFTVAVESRRATLLI